MSLALACGALLVSCLIYLRFSWKPGLKPPPGPKPIPILGNFLDLPPKGTHEFQHWLRHKEVYGPISSVTILGQTLVIIHDEAAANILLERTSAKTSGRPTFEFLCKLCGYGDLLSTQQYNDNFRRGRRFLHQQLGTKRMAGQFNTIHEVEVRRFLLRVLTAPESLIEHLKIQAGASILKVTYGYSVERNKPDPLIELVEKMMRNFTSAAAPLTWLVDAIPALQYLPSFLPGMKFMKTAQEWKRITQDTVEIPYSLARGQMKTSTNRPSYVSKLVQQLKQQSVESTVASSLSGDNEHAIKWTAATLYAAGSDTTAMALSSFVLAMVMFPKVQQKAQAEIDRVVGTDRLPQFSDEPKLSYIQAVVQETLRWSPVTPLAFPHATTEQTFYNGYLIAKGAYLIPSVWWFLHNPDVYRDPNSFDPDRFLQPRNEPDPRRHAFGYGRRICPGRHFADLNIYLTIAQTLAAFKISPLVDEEGLEVEAKLEVTPGAISHVVDFPYRIRPRGIKQETMIRSFEVDQTWEKGDAALLETSWE